MTDYPLAQACAEFLKTEASQAARAKAAAYEAAENPGAKWERGACSCGGGRSGWSVNLHRGPDNKVMQFAEYPVKQFYTDEELPALLLQPARRVVVPDSAMFEEAAAVPVRFNEAECGGAFDGFTVTSDADPGL